MRLRLAAWLAVLVALGITAPPAFASSIGVTAPATSPQGQSMTVHMAGTADESSLAVMGVVRQQACPATRDAALALPGPRENELSVAQGSFSLDMNLITFDQSSGQNLSGPVNVCVYVYRTTGDGATVATNSTSVVLTSGSTGGGFGVQIPAKQHMASNGTIKIAATCPAGCTVKAHAGKGHAVTKHLGASSSAVTIKLPLTRAVKHRVKQARRKHKTVSVPVSATATPTSGAKKTVSRTVKVS